MFWHAGFVFLHAEFVFHENIHGFHAVLGRERKLIRKWLGAVLVVWNIPSFLVLERCASRDELLVGLLPRITRCPEDPGLEQLMKSRLVPHTFVVP